MNSDGIEILHRADSYHVAGCVAHRLELDLFPAGDAFFHQHLADRRKIKPRFGDGAQLRLIPCNTAAAAAKCEGRPHNNRISNPRSNGKSFLHLVCHVRWNHRLTHLAEHVTEQFPIFGTVDSFHVRTEQAHPIACKRPVSRKLHGEGQPHLTAQTGEQTVRPFHGEDTAQRLRSQGFQIDRVCQALVSHNGGRVGIDQNC